MPEAGCYRPIVFVPAIGPHSAVARRNYVPEGKRASMTDLRNLSRVPETASTV